MEQPSGYITLRTTFPKAPPGSVTSLDAIGCIEAGRFVTASTRLRPSSVCASSQR